MTRFSIPAGATVIIGAPAKAPPRSKLEALQASLRSHGVQEAHLALLYGKERGPAPKLALAAVVETVDSVPESVDGDLAAAVAEAEWPSELDVTLVSEPELVAAVRKADVQVAPTLSDAWASRTGNQVSPRQVAVAVVISLLILLAAQYL